MRRNVVGISARSRLAWVAIGESMGDPCQIRRVRLLVMLVACHPSGGPLPKSAWEIVSPHVCYMPQVALQEYRQQRAVKVIPVVGD